MSVAGVWQDTDGAWHGVHDGVRCVVEGARVPAMPHVRPDGRLAGLLTDMEQCLSLDGPCALQWELHTYPDGTAALRGYIA
jgi:hypothetical protein